MRLLNRLHFTSLPAQYCNWEENSMRNYPHPPTQMKALWKTAELSKQNISESLTVQCSSPNYQGYFYFVSSAAPVWRRNQKETETRESLLQSNPVDPSQQENTQRRGGTRAHVYDGRGKDQGEEV
ncbi:unnamed protein product [Boreogadus saida]